VNIKVGTDICSVIRVRNTYVKYGVHGIGWKEIEVTRHPSGAPSIKLHGRAAKLAQDLGLTTFEVSLSHEKDYATAFVIGYSQ
jgi:phosphopantetheine--protein transferase-like protein